MFHPDLTCDQWLALSGEGIWITDDGGRTIGANPRAAEILGSTPADLASRALADFCFPGELPGLLARLRSSREEAPPVRFEQRFRRTDGDEAWCVVSTRAIAGGQAAGRQHLLALSDITAHHRTTRELRESEERYRTLFETMAQGVVYQSADGRITSANQAAERILGRSVADMLAMTSRDVEWKAIHEDGRPFPGSDHPAMVALSTGRPVHDVLMGVHNPATGEYQWIKTHSVPRLGPDGQTPIETCTTFEDITAQKAQEENRQRLETRLLQSQKLESLGRLAGGVAHEFNNLLTSILGHADLAFHDLPPESPVRDNVRAIETAARRAAEVSHQMLAYSGRGRFVVGPVDVSKVIRETVRMVEVSVSKDTTLHFELADPLPVIEADAAQLRQAVMNLVVNASEALEGRPGIVTVRTGAAICAEGSRLVDHLQEPVPPGRYVFLEVTDTGSGMGPETLERIFDPFFSTKFTGRGLGLPAVSGIARGHRGHVQVTSEPGRGSTFRLLFPARAEPAADTKRGEGAESGEKPVAPLVLVVDDEDGVRSLTIRLVERCGYRAVGAVDGLEALHIVQERLPDLACVVLDMTMPRLGGEETLRELRKMSAVLPVLVSSGFEGREIAERLADLSPSGFLQKPYQLADIREKLVAALKRRGSGSGPAGA